MCAPIPISSLCREWGEHWQDHRRLGEKRPPPAKRATLQEGLLPPRCWIRRLGTLLFLVASGSLRWTGFCSDLRFGRPLPWTIPVSLRSRFCYSLLFVWCAALLEQCFVGGGGAHIEQARGPHRNGKKQHDIYTYAWNISAICIH